MYLHDDVQMYCCPYCDRIEFKDEDHYFEHVTMCDAQFEEDYDEWTHDQQNSAFCPE